MSENSTFKTPIPESLHRAIKAAAALRGITLQQYARDVFARETGWLDPDQPAQSDDASRAA